MQKSSSPSVYYIRLEADFTEQRIDNFLMTQLKGVPKTRIYRILRKGEVRVNKKRVPPSYRLQPLDEIRIPPIQVAEQASKPAPGRSLMTLLSERIIYEDKGLLIINKPSGIPVHGGSQVKIGIVETLRCMYPNLPDLELVHRLDADTSGCLILAKKRGILKEMHELLRLGNMHKVYLALTKGCWKSQELRVEVALRKNYLSNGERIVKVDAEGKQALTVFAPRETFAQAMLVEATLHTGRTHQIRVHAQYRQHPIAGDEKYGDKEFNKIMRQHGLKRLFLHATSLAFVLPSTGQKIAVTCPLDEDLVDCLERLS